MMKAVYYDTFQGPVTVRQVPLPTLSSGSLLIQVKATGLCRSDWHGWQGHDPDIALPHVPGHELAGIVIRVSPEIRNLAVGDRVTVPFVSGCGGCEECAAGMQHVCDRQFQPGFTAWGSLAEVVQVKYAEFNVVRLPDDIDFVTAASLGCRFVTAFRAVVDQAKVQPGQIVAVHGCGGVGLSAIMIAATLGATVIAVDIHNEKLQLAQRIGAAHIIHARMLESRINVPDEIRRITDGRGAHVSIDALGSQETCFNSIACLRKRGRHVQVGLMTADHKHPLIPMDKVIAHELEIVGSHGMQAHRYPDMFRMIKAGRLKPQLLVGKTISLLEAPKALMEMDKFDTLGVTIINEF